MLQLVLVSSHVSTYWDHFDNKCHSVPMDTLFPIPILMNTLFPIPILMNTVSHSNSHEHTVSHSNSHEHTVSHSNSHVVPLPPFNGSCSALNESCVQCIFNYSHSVRRDCEVVYRRLPSDDPNVVGQQFPTGLYS